MQEWNRNPSIFAALPEFPSIPELAKKIKDKGCTCGLGGEIARVTGEFNQTVSNLNPESVIRMKALFNVQSLCFGIETAGNYNTKCY